VIGDSEVTAGPSMRLRGRALVRLRGHDDLGAWLGVEQGLITHLPPALIQSLHRRREDLERANARIESYLQVGAVVGRHIVELKAQSRVDPLTDALNRRGIEEVLATETGRARRTGDPLAVVLVDVDGLKRFNDDLGHAAGDELLRAAASGIRSQMRTTDRVGRIGGDEFLAVLPRTNAAEAERIADRIAGATRNLHISAAPMRPLGVSTGWASTSEGHDVPTRLTATADRRLYERRSQRRSGAA
jgi:diguanylate cyclase (GGDEF)-like protein